MANISLSQVRDLWKRVSDWISGATADKPGVTVYGSDDGGTTRRAVSTDESGALKTQLTGNIVDGTIETLGSRAQLWKTNPTSSMSIMEALKGIMTLMEDGTPGPSRLAQIQTLLADPATSAKQDAAKGVLDAISAAVAARATEATLESAKQALASLDGKVATAAKQDAAKVVLDAISTAVAARATEATLAQIKTALTDPATSAKQDAAKVVLDAISTAVAARATEATLAQIKTALTDGTLKAQLSGSLLERYGATVAERPAANSVPVGTVYMAVQAQELWQSDGSQWVVM